MCGILGLIGRVATGADAQSLVSLIRHRGPDGHGIWRCDGVLFVHARLAIIDLDTGAQPMVSADGRFSIIFNGEIYNYREVRQTLAALGRRFVTESDTEVILQAFAVWGPACLERFRGMFAVAIADVRDKTVFLARDPFGIKPLFYAAGTAGLGFASELGALLSAIDLPREIPSERIDFFLRYGHVPAPMTLYRDFHKLAPGHWVKADFEGRVSTPVRYFTPTFDATCPVPADEEIEAGLRDSVRAHLIADVPRGVLLSGGVDSSLVSLFAAEQEVDLFSAYTMQFRRDTEGGEDAAFAAELAAKLGLRHETGVIDGTNIDQLPAILEHFGEPFGDSSILPTDMVSALARRDVPVVLSGEGADEMFAGYSVYARWLKADVGMTPWKDLGLLRRLSPARWTQVATRWLESSHEPMDELSWEKATAVFPRDLRASLWRDEWTGNVSVSCPPVAEAVAEAQGLDRLSFAQYVHMRTHLPNDMLAKVDVASMRHGLEVRTPFLDVDVFKLARRVPSASRIEVDFTGAAVPKAPLKRILSKHMSTRFAHRPKRGFEIPRADFFGPASESRRMLEDLTIGSKDLGRLFQMDQVNKMLVRPHENSDRLWFLLVIGIWWDQYGRKSNLVAS